ncbi:MAG: GNAT family N-acetyltransferase, partial [Acidilobus sp.]
MVRLRPYREEDLRQLLEVEEESFPAGQRYSAETFRYLMSLRGSFTVVAEEDGIVVGYVIGYMEGRGVGHVASLAVRKAYRRRGVGTALMLEAERLLREE